MPNSKKLTAIEVSAVEARGSGTGGRCRVLLKATARSKSRMLKLIFDFDHRIQVYIIGFTPQNSINFRIRVMGSDGADFKTWSTKAFNTIKGECTNRIFVTLEFRGVMTRQGVLSKTTDNVHGHLKGSCDSLLSHLSVDSAPFAICCICTVARS